MGENACTLGWNLKPRTPYSVDQAADLTHPLRPLAGSIVAKGMITSGLLRAASAISSLGTAGVPVAASASTVKTTQAIFRSR